jgi:type III pantothenate kinase
LRYESLHNYTSKLPLLSLEDSLSFIGRSTKGINSFRCNVMVYEIDGFIDEYKVLGSNFIIILTGGDTEFFAKRLLKYHICQFKFSLRV